MGQPVNNEVNHRTNIHVLPLVQADGTVDQFVFDDNGQWAIAHGTRSMPFMKSDGSAGTMEISKDGLVTIDGRCTDGSREKLNDLIRFARVTDAALQIIPTVAATYFANSLGIDMKLGEMDALIRETPVGLVLEPFVTGASLLLNSITRNLFSRTPGYLFDACLADPAGRQVTVK